MKKLNLIFLSFSIFLACSNKQEILHKETLLFEKYLKENFNENISSEKKVFFVIPSFTCYGCKKHLLQFLYTTKYNLSIITVEKFNTQFSDNINILFDKKKKVDRLNLGISNTFAIFIENKKIIKIKEVIPGHINEIEKLTIQFQ